MPGGINGSKRNIAWKLMPVQLVAIVAFALAAWLLLPYYLQKSAEEHAILAANQMANHFTVLRRYYTDRVVRKVIHSGSDLAIHYDHKIRPDTIPLPASLIHDLGDLLKDSSITLDFYSPFPFRNRKGREMDAFGNAAWAALTNNREDYYHRSMVNDDRHIVRLAVADLMVDQLCVDCHNNHPLSPKTDWKLGDLRGVLEISHDITDLVENGRWTGRYLTLALLTVFGTITVLSFRTTLTEVKHWTDELEQNEKDLQTAQEIAHIGSWSLNPITDKLIWSEEVFRIYGIDSRKSGASVDGFLSAIHPDELDYVTEQYAGAIEGKFSYDIEHRIIRKDSGEIRWVHERCSHLRNELGEVIRSDGIVQDITERKLAQDEIQRLAMTDELTGLNNRNQFHQWCDQYIKLARREEKRLAMMLLDLDRFKPVNDKYGHPVGDALLQAVASILKQQSRDTDMVARIGGDEFAILVVHPKNRESAGISAQRIIDEIEKPMNIMSCEIQIGISIGIAMCPDDADDEENMIHKADIALYDAKKSGRNTFRFYTPELNGDTK